MRCLKCNAEKIKCFDTEKNEYLLCVMCDAHDISSNNIRECAYCKIQLDAENDSGWEVFVGDGSITQSICKNCDGVFLQKMEK